MSTGDGHFKVPRKLSTAARRDPKTVVGVTGTRLRNPESGLYIWLYASLIFERKTAYVTIIESTGRLSAASVGF